jgi:hypothetical protein
MISAMCLICWVSIFSILIGLLSLSEDEAEELSPSFSITSGK